MPTLLAVFKDRTDPETVIDSLVESGIERARIGLVWREKIVHSEEEIEVVSYVDHFETPSEEARKGAWGGLIGGATAGLAGALLASAGIALGPGVVTLLGTGTAAAAAVAAGAAGGSITGGAIGALLGATDHDATKVKTTKVEQHDATETDGFIVTVETDESDSENTAMALKEAGATDLTALGGDGSNLRIHLD